MSDRDTKPSPRIISGYFSSNKTPSLTSSKVIEEGKDTKDEEMAGLDKRPRNDEGGPTVVSVNYFILSIPEISAAENSFVGDFYLDLHWTEPKLIGRDEDDVDWKSVWGPDVEFPNARDVEKDFENWLLDSKTGEIIYQTRVRANFSSTMTVRDFPFDSQQLEIHMESGAHTADEVVLKLLESSKGNHVKRKLKKDGLAEWHMGDISSQSEVHKLEFDGTVYSTFKININVLRRGGYYVYKIVLPFSFIVLMSFSAYFMEASEISDRVGTAIEAALTATAFQVVVNESIPKVGYLTFLDIYLMTTFITICATCAESVFVYLQSKRKVDELEIEYIDALAFRLSVCVLFLSLVTFLWQWTEK